MQRDMPTEDLTVPRALQPSTGRLQFAFWQTALFKSCHTKLN